VKTQISEIVVFMPVTSGYQIKTIICLRLKRVSRWFGIKRKGEKSGTHPRVLHELQMVQVYCRILERQIYNFNSK
jgi:hypothetical protein